MTKTKKAHSRNWKLPVVIGGAIATLFAISAGWYIYFATTAHYKDHDLFSYIGLPYTNQNVQYSYADNDGYALTFARVSPEQAKTILKNPSTVFPECHKKSVYIPSDDKLRCTETWIPNTTMSANLVTGMQNDKEKQAAENAYKTTITKDSYCTFSPNAPLWKTVVIRHTLCVNPTNGYVMYEYLAP